jgi:hypothetical protein
LPATRRRRSELDPSTQQDGAGGASGGDADRRPGIVLNEFVRALGRISRGGLNALRSIVQGRIGCVQRTLEPSAGLHHAAFVDVRGTPDQVLDVGDEVAKLTRPGASGDLGRLLCGLHCLIDGFHHTGDRNGRLAVLGTGGEVHDFLYDREREIFAPTATDQTLDALGMACFPTASELFKAHRYE